MKKLYQGKKVDFMPNILPVSDLRNYNEVLKNCQVGEPVFLTQNGRGEYSRAVGSYSIIRFYSWNYTETIV